MVRAMLFAAAVLAVCVGGGVAAAGVFDGDARLERRVSLDEGRIYLGELLDRLSRETGARLKASDRVAPISGYDVTVIARDLPVREVLEGLPRLFGTARDRWHWQREGRGREARYVLRNSLPLAALRTGREEALVRLLLELRARRAAFYRAPPEEQQAMAARDRYWATILRGGERSRASFSFIEGLPASEIARLARGGSLEIPIGGLDARQRAYVRREYEIQGQFGRAGVVQPDELDKLRLYGRAGDNSLYLEIQPLGSQAVLGGIWSREPMREWARREWVGPGENTSAPADPVPAPGVPATREELVFGGMTHGDALCRLARLARLNILADPRSPSATFGSAVADFNRPLPQVLQMLETASLLWKRRDPFYYFRQEEPGEWEREARVPWPLIRALRASAAEREGRPTLADCLSVALLQQNQLEHLGGEFPVALTVRNYQPVFRLAAEMSPRERTASRRDDGAGWDDLEAGSRQKLAVILTPADARRALLVLREERDERTEVPHLLVYLGPAPARPRVVELPPRKEPPARRGCALAPPAARGGG